MLFFYRALLKEGPVFSICMSIPSLQTTYCIAAVVLSSSVIALGSTCRTREYEGPTEVL